jgi:hypothetical protein
MVGAGDQQVGKEPFFEDLTRTLRKTGKPDTSAASVIAPYHLRTGMNETFGFRKIETEVYSSVDFESFTGLDGEAIFMHIEQFAEVHDQAGLRSVETGVNRSVEFLTNKAAALSIGRPCNWIRQSLNAPIHSYSILTQESEGMEEDQPRRQLLE